MYFGFRLGGFEKKMRIKNSIAKHKKLIKQILFTAVILFIYRLGSTVMLASVRTGNLSEIAALDFFSAMTGGGMDSFTLFALGLSPFITSAIVIELLSNDVIKPLARIKKDNDTEKKNKIVNILGVFIALLQSASITYVLDNQYGILIANDICSYIFTCGMLTAGSILLLWLSKQIDIYGIGNGSSMIIACGILCRLPSTICSVFDEIVSYSHPETFAIFAALMSVYILMIMFVVYFGNSEIRIPIQFSAMSHIPSGKNSDYLPIKVNPSGVVPVIFASSIMQVVVLGLQLAGYSGGITSWFSLYTWQGILLYGVMTFIFTFYYSRTIINPKDIAENFRKTECSIWGVRPGKETADYISHILNRVCFYGALSLLVIALVPVILPMFWDAAGYGLTIGGTSLIIVSGVMLEICNRIRSDNRKNYRKPSVWKGRR